MKGKPALGRGLSALLPSRSDENVPRGTAREVDIDRLVSGRFQPRQDFPDRSLAELADSIREQGVVQPIVVVPRGDRFEIVAGERRWRAARKAGLERVPVVVREKATDRDLLEIALVENLQREDLNPLEAAAAYARLREEFQLTQEDVARRVGKDRATIANSLRLLKLPPAVREKVRDGSLSAGHARALLALASPDDQVSVAEEIVRRALSVRQTESRIRALTAGTRITRPPAARPVHARRGGEAFAAARNARPHPPAPPGRIDRHRISSEEELIGLFERLSSVSKG